jgi:hypothetical protein
MAKIGPQIPAGIPRPRTEAGGDAKTAKAPASQQQAPGTKGGPPAPASNPTVQAQQVVQQFGSAFASAGKLASQLMRGLSTPTPAQQRRNEKTEKSDDAQGGQHAEGEHGAEEAGDKNPLMSAFAALKRSKIFRFRKTKKKQAGKAGHVETSTGIVLEDDDYKEQEREHRKARDYLAGDEQEQSQFNQARREALFMQHLERQGEPPSRIARHLNSQLGSSRDQQFKHLLSDQVRPQMEAMATKVGEVPSDERRALAALVSRAAYQVGTQGSGTFEKLLSAAGMAEAEQLAEVADTAATQAAQFKQALQRASNPAYRAALIEAARGSLEKIAADSVGLPPEERQQTWTSLLRSAETLRPESHAALAEAVMAGVLGIKRPNAADTLIEALGPALRTVPGGGSWVVQLIITFAARGQTQAAERLASEVLAVLREARTSCVPAFKQLRDITSRPSKGTDSEEKLLREVEAVAPPLVSLIPACSQVLEKGAALPPGAAPLIGEAVVAMAALDLLGPTAAGQRLLRHALLAQEREGQTFLTTLPKVARTLAQPQVVRPIVESGLVVASYQSGARLFLEHVATYTSRALAAPVLARSQKGDASSARALLRSAVRSNAELLGLTPDGAHLAADALEALRDKPNPMALQLTLTLLEKIRLKHNAAKFPYLVEPLKALATALGERAAPVVPTQGQGTGSRPALNLTRLELAMDQAAVLKQQTAPREAPAPEPKPAPGSPARGRK